MIKELVAMVTPAETNNGNVPRMNDFIACLVFVCRDIFNGYQKWHYRDLTEKQEIGERTSVQLYVVAVVIVLLLFFIVVIVIVVDIVFVVFVVFVAVVFVVVVFVVFVVVIVVVIVVVVCVGFRA